MYTLKGYFSLAMGWVQFFRLLRIIPWSSCYNQVLLPQNIEDRFNGFGSIHCYCLVLLCDLGLLLGLCGWKELSFFCPNMLETYILPPHPKLSKV